MKHALLALAALLATVGSTGFKSLPGRCQGQCPPAAQCNDCGHGHRLGHHGGPGVLNHRAPAPVEAGPPSAQVAYPYYTTRGPRDFLNPNPPSIGY